MNDKFIFLVYVMKGEFVPCKFYLFCKAMLVFINVSSQAADALHNAAQQKIVKTNEYSFSVAINANK